MNQMKRSCEIFGLDATTGLAAPEYIIDMNIKEAII